MLHKAKSFLNQMLTSLLTIDCNDNRLTTNNRIERCNLTRQGKEASSFNTHASWKKKRSYSCQNQNKSKYYVCKKNTRKNPLSHYPSALSIKLSNSSSGRHSLRSHFCIHVGGGDYLLCLRELCLKFFAC